MALPIANRGAATVYDAVRDLRQSLAKRLPYLTHFSMA